MNDGLDRAFEVFADHYNLHPDLINLLSEIIKSIRVLQKANQKPVDAENEWLTFHELCDKYPFMSTGSIHEMVRNAPNENDYLKYDPQFGKLPLFNPKNFIKHLHETYHLTNGRQYPRLYARLKKKNFFGFV